MLTKTALAKLRRVGSHKIAEDRDYEENRPPNYHPPRRYWGKCRSPLHR